MGFQVSPGINVSEVDLTTIVPAVSTTAGAIAGLFRWGPIGQLVLVDSEKTLATRYGAPTNYNAETFFTAKNFLSYGNQLFVSRAANTTDTTSWVGTSNSTFTAVANASAVYGSNSTTSNVIYNITNSDAYNAAIATGTLTTTAQGAGIYWIAKYPGAIGNSLRISQVDSATQFSSNIANVASTTFALGSNTATFSFVDNSYVAANAAYQALTVGDWITVGNSTVGFQNLQLSAKPATTPSANTLALNFYNNYTLGATVNMGTTTPGANVGRLWEFYNSVNGAPGTSYYQNSYGNSSVTDQVHVVVEDYNGTFSGTPGQILEVWQGLSRATDSMTQDGSSNYYQTVISQNSSYVWWSAHRGSSAYANTANNLVNVTTGNLPLSTLFNGGQDGFGEANVTTATVSTLLQAWSLFISTENSNPSLLITGKAPDTTTGVAPLIQQYVIDNIATIRKDCVAFCSPPKNTVVNNVGNEYSSVITYTSNTLNRSTSYAVMDSGYKYQYDKYNDVYRYIPLNGDIAGLCVYTDTTRDPWWSPAGFNRGQIKNIVKLAYNPKKAERDLLYPAGINPVVTFPGQGTVLYGDKTLLQQSSAFSHINVRRLFIVLEKAISAAAQTTLFEFNDSFTQAQFISLVTPFLKDVQGRRGISDFYVVCDATNNTPQVVNSNQFVGDIYIKPAYSINFIQLNFTAVRTGVSFSEIVGKF